MNLRVEREAVALEVGQQLDDAALELGLGEAGQVGHRLGGAAGQRVGWRVHFGEGGGGAAVADVGADGGVLGHAVEVAHGEGALFARVAVGRVQGEGARAVLAGADHLARDLAQVFDLVAVLPFLVLLAQSALATAKFRDRLFSNCLLEISFDVSHFDLFISYLTST